MTVIRNTSAATTWVCSHCDYAQVVSASKEDHGNSHVDIKGLAEGHVIFSYRAKGCSNPDCMKLTAYCYLVPASMVGTSNGPEFYPNGAAPLAGMRFLPKGASKPQPPYIPQPLVTDYDEACAIVELSPKASATLVRRCLQGMIRDFCGISRSTLALEISALRDTIEQDAAPRGVLSETVDAIHHVKSIGNIGAHMEKDINIIVDVDADEAKTLISLVEMLFDEWYVARHRRTERLQAITTLGSQKQAERQQAPLLIGPAAAIPTASD
jgi:hypothetical protein